MPNQVQVTGHKQLVNCELNVNQVSQVTPCELMAMVMYVQYYYFGQSPLPQVRKFIVTCTLIGQPALP